MAEWAVGVRKPTLSWAQHMNGGRRPSLLAAISFPDLKKVPI